MLPKINRLTKDKEFSNVFNPPAGGGRSSFDKIMGVKAVSNDLENNRIGILVGTKISKKTVERNKIRRRISEIIRLEQGKMAKGYDLVVITLPEIKNKEYEEIKKSLARHFKKLKLLK